ncbi:MAG TPA: Sir2 family NAD-dependent protein deacetylase [Pirellulales bacterium]|jgi:NAD-dependent deacetylase
MSDELEHNGLFRRMARTLRDARRLVVFTGAGVSAESGIGTFRDEDGLWSRFPPEVFANWEGLLSVAIEEPSRAAEFFLALLEPMVQAQPNAAHRAIAALEGHLDVTVITQNIDGLHELAGSSRVHTIHGTLYETMYLDGRPRGPSSRAEIANVVQALRPLCAPSATFDQLQEAVAPLMGMDADGPYRPKIVMFGDLLSEPDWSRAQQAASECDFLLAVGTSGIVYPAATLPHLARRNGATVAAIDPQPVEGYIWLEGNAATLLPSLVAEAFK